MKVAIIGANGQLGSELVEHFLKKKWQVYPLKHKDIEITDKKSVIRALGKIKPQLVINTAAYHKVDKCQLYPKRAFEVNVWGAKNVAEWTERNGAQVVYISTDFVFGEKERKRPYEENDLLSPINCYGLSKAAGELMVASLTRKHFIVRTSGLYGKAGSSMKGKNFVDRILDWASSGKKIRMVSDKISSPTSAKTVAVNLESLLKTKKFGTYHMVSKGSCSWYEFTKQILKYANLKTKVFPIKSDQDLSISPRPLYSVLINTNLNKQKLDKMPTWRQGLKEYIREKI